MHLHALSESLSAVIEPASPFLVRVEGRHRGASTGFAHGSDGLFVTAAHTLDREDGITLGLPDGTEVQAKLRGYDAGTDLAVLEAPDGKGQRSPRFVESAGLKVGHLAVAVARPGKSVRASLSMIEAVAHEAWHTPSGGRVDRYVELDRGAPHGFSGGLLLNSEGRAVGVYSAGLLRRTPLLVPSETVGRVVDAIVNKGRVERGYLGIGAQPVRLGGVPEAGQPIGLLVVAVQPDGPAAKGGLLIGDVVLSVDGKGVERVWELQAALDDEKVGKPVELKLLRAGKRTPLTVTVGARP